MRKYNNDDWRKLANSPHLDDEFDDIYEEQDKLERKQKRKEKERHGLKEEFFNF